MLLLQVILILTIRYNKISFDCVDRLPSPLFKVTRTHLSEIPSLPYFPSSCLLVRKDLLSKFLYRSSPGQAKLKRDAQYKNYKENFYRVKIRLKNELTMK